MSTYEIRCSGGAMGNGTYLEPRSERKAKSRAKVYAGEGLLGQGYATVYRVSGCTISGPIATYFLNKDGKVRALS